MITALVFKKAGDFLKKNWKVVGIIIAFLVVSGILRRFIGRIQMWWSVRKYKDAGSDTVKVDYDFMAMSVHEAMYQGLFNWGENEAAITALINTLSSQAEFLELCRRYAFKYGKDLRMQLRKHFNDKKYSRLNWK